MLLGGNIYAFTLWKLSYRKTMALLSCFCSIFPSSIYCFFSSIYCYFLVYILRFPISYTLIIYQAEMHISENEVMRLRLHI